MLHLSSTGVHIWSSDQTRPGQILTVTNGTNPVTVCHRLDKRTDWITGTDWIRASACRQKAIPAHMAVSTQGYMVSRLPPHQWPPVSLATATSKITHPAQPATHHLSTPRAPITRTIVRKKHIPAPIESNPPPLPQRAGAGSDHLS